MKTQADRRRRSRLAALVIILTTGLVLEAGVKVGLAQPGGRPVDTAASRLSYTGHHKLHDWTGTSEQVTGTLWIDTEAPQRSRVEISVPVESFDSGNSSRDSNMLDVVEAERYQAVRFQSEEIIVESWEKAPGGFRGTWRVRGRLTFHGKEQPVEIPMDVVVRGGRLSADGSFSIELDRFGVKRPKLLLMPIENAIDLTAHIEAHLGADAGA